MRCEDCIHFKRCVTLGVELDMQHSNNADKNCRHFNNKADFMKIQHGYNATDEHPVDEFVCSVCGFACEDFTEIVTDEDRDDTWHQECEFDYCPHCGAKMDK